MAEWESGYCTGCGCKIGRRHRPYCWRMIEIATGIRLGESQVENLSRLMHNHWRFTAWLKCKQKHVYFYPSGGGLT